MRAPLHLGVKAYCFLLIIEGTKIIIIIIPVSIYWSICWCRNIILVSVDMFHYNTEQSIELVSYEEEQSRPANINLG